MISNLVFLFKNILLYFKFKNFYKRNSKELEKLKIRIGKIAQFYTVISFRTDEIEREELAQKLRISEKLQPYAEFFEKYNLDTELNVEIEKIDDYNYLIFFIPNYYPLSFFWILFWFLTIVLLSFFSLVFLIFYNK